MSKRLVAGVSPCTLAAVGLLGLMTAHQVGQRVSQGFFDALAPCASESATVVELAEASEAEAPAHDRLAGLWTRFEGRSEGDPLRFWYFHGNGKGLYRYGRVGYANTHSFDYSLRGDTLELRFRKTGERHVLEVEIDEREGARSMRFGKDPREEGASYRFEAGPMHETLNTERGRFGLDDRVWIDLRRYATGGMGFAMYQLQPAAIDGRGVGWFHEGDFDEWRTEALSYRIDGERIEFFFELNEELGVSEFRLVKGDDGQRHLRLEQDPRDFWLQHDYRDGGRSFAGAEVLPLMVGGQP